MYVCRQTIDETKLILTDFVGLALASQSARVSRTGQPTCGRSLWHWSLTIPRTWKQCPRVLLFFPNRILTYRMMILQYSTFYGMAVLWNLWWLHIAVIFEHSCKMLVSWRWASLQRVQKYAMGRLYEQHMEFSMACEDVEYAYANTSPTSKLRQFYMILSNKPSQTWRNCVDLLEIGMQFAEGSRPSHLITLEHPTKFILQVSPQIPERIYFRRSQLHRDYTISYRTYEIVSQTEEEEQEKDVNGQHKEWRKCKWEQMWGVRLKLDLSMWWEEVEDPYDYKM